MPGYRLVWNDEFDRNGPPDAAKWNFEKGFCRNNEAQWYQADNAVCRDGLLVIEGRRERVPNPNYDPKSNDWKRSRQFAEYTSSSLNTWGKFDWQLSTSIITVRARLTPQPGYFPAIWTTGPGIWPHGGEVDLMECYGGRVLANFAWGTTQRWGAHWHSYDSPNQPDKNKPKISYFVGKDPDWLAKFHVWKLVGSAERTQIFCDYELLNEVTHEVATNPRVDFATVVHPFTEKHALILNLALGGPGGDPSPAKAPFVYEVDYARVYQVAQP
ncbi:MAG: glycoside hydrolase family 16 protein [Armatimonadetes bacterium]|nr:glycoside hydrolase family 16 protein [Armatimonadota bacterium]